MEKRGGWARVQLIQGVECQDLALKLDPSLCPRRPSFAWFCAADFGRADPSSPIWGAAVLPGVRQVYPVL